MQSSARLVTHADFTVDAVTCRDEHAGWSEAESPRDYRMVLVRSGRFRRRTRSGAAEVDRLSAYLGIPGEPEHFAHPAGGDVCTAITIGHSLWHAIAGDEVRTVAPTVCIDARLDLEHRRLVADAAGGDIDFACAERLSSLVSAAVAEIVATAVPAAGGSRDCALVAAARTLLHDNDPAAAGLLPLAAELSVSPYRLSRAFTRETGVSLTRYRNRLRVSRAMDSLERQDAGLADLAAELGFADQAHLTRTVRAHLGHTPTAVKALLRTA